MGAFQSFEEAITWLDSVGGVLTLTSRAGDGSDELMASAAGLSQRVSLTALADEAPSAYQATVVAACDGLREELEPPITKRDVEGSLAQYWRNWEESAA